VALWPLRRNKCNVPSLAVTMAESSCGDTTAALAASPRSSAPPSVAPPGKPATTRRAAPSKTYPATGPETCPGCPWIVSAGKSTSIAVTRFKIAIAIFQDRKGLSLYKCCVRPDLLTRGNADVFTQAPPTPWPPGTRPATSSPSACRWRCSVGSDDRSSAGWAAPRRCGIGGCGRTRKRSGWL
jgi:hypothetical protein